MLRPMLYTICVDSKKRANVIRGFFFDLDGTLVNTYEADYLAYRDAIEEIVGVRIGQDAFAKTHGQEMKAKLALLVPDISPTAVPQIAAAKKKHYQKYLELTVVNETLVRFMSECAEHSVLALVTTAKRDNALAVLQAHDLERYFTHMVFGEDVKASKPDPESYLLALSRSGLASDEVIAFEDSESGIEAARAAGIAVIHVEAFAA